MVDGPTTDDIDFGLDTYRAAQALAGLGLNLPVPYVVFVHHLARRQAMARQPSDLLFGLDEVRQKRDGHHPYHRQQGCQ